MGREEKDGRRGWRRKKSWRIKRSKRMQTRKIFRKKKKCRAIKKKDKKLKIGKNENRKGGETEKQ